MDFHNIGLESILIDGPSLQTVAVGIDSIERIIENLSNARTLLYAEPHESQNSEIGVHLHSILEHNPGIRAKQLIDTLYKIGIHVEKRIVENLVELTSLLLREFSGPHHSQELVALARSKFTRRNLTELIDLIHVDRTELEELTDVGSRWQKQFPSFLISSIL